MRAGEHGLYIIHLLVLVLCTLHVFFNKCLFSPPDSCYS